MADTSIQLARKTGESIIILAGTNVRVQVVHTSDHGTLLRVSGDGARACKLETWEMAQRGMNEAEES